MYLGLRGGNIHREFSQMFAIVVRGKLNSFSATGGGLFAGLKTLEGGH